ncbi:TonB-dependent receptor [Polynucleobacter sp. 31A-FELB]|jgi:iron complex outermembrane receptor protein|uniref:TonB-dependent receptor n=1 Tax=Polynucleobacter sp. 31A-FELB TaxID=2689096 RepID=UPI001C0BAA29|nr:TonB-dependent receptor [Polynucleobacter sp. 31A-FELB]MBU3587276.1 TonB-dependent receptor [Polynucleobacter sp. 31A-FELB]
MKQWFSSKTLVALICGIAATFSTVAQNSQSTIVVSGSRFEENLNEVPANVKVITRDEIANSTSNNIPDVLSQIGGLVVRSSNSGQLNLDATVDMGGFGATANSNTLILVDGQRMNPIDSLGVAWESIPIDSIERIEIVQGGASVQYGNGAVGGVINIITNGGKMSLNQASITAGSYGTYIGNAILRNKIENTTLQLTANSSNSQGWRANSAANAYAFDAKVSQALGGIDNVYADVYYSYTNQQTPGGVVGQVGQGNPQAAKFNNMGAGNTANNSGVRAGGIKSLSDAYTAMIDITYGNRDINYGAPYYASTDSVGGYFPGPSNGNISSWDLALTPRIKADFGSWGTTVVGYDYGKSNQNSNNQYTGAAQELILANQSPNGWFYNNQLNNTQSANLINQSAYIISRVPLSNAIEASGGFRRQTQNASTNDSNFYAPTPTSASQKYSANAGDVAINYSYQKNQKVYAKWNQSFRFPNVDEFWGWDPSGNRIFSGILKPQTTQTYEIGGEWSTGNVRVSGSAFQSLTQNEIRYDPTTYYNTNSADNIGRKGVLLDSTFNPTSKLSISGGGKFQKSTYTTGIYSGTGVSLVPDLILNARAQYLINASWSFGGVINFVSQQMYDSEPGISNSLAKMPSYTVGDLFASYKTNKWESRLTIKNVGGVNYSSYGGYGSLSTPGGGLTSGYYYYPSDPRSVFLSVKYTL